MTIEEIKAALCASPLTQPQLDAVQQLLVLIEQPLVFSVGDTVQLVDYATREVFEGKHIIMEAVAREGGVEYATDRGAWYDHDEFQLVTRATPETLAIVIAKAGEDADAEDEDDDERNDERKF